MAIKLSDVSNALTKVLLPYIRDNLPKETLLLDKLKRSSDAKFMNDNFYAPVRSGRHGGVVALADDDNALVSSKSSIGQASVGVKIMTGTFNISKLAMDATKTKKGAVENQLTFQAKSLMTDFKRSLNRQFFSDGIGVVAQVRTTGGSVGSGTAALEYPDSNLDDGRSTDWYGTVNGDISPMKHIAVDQVLGFGTAGADLGTVASVTGTSVVVTGAPGIAASDSVYLMDGSGGGANVEILGMRAALSSSTGTSTYASLARSTDGWTPQFGSTSEALTITRMEDKYISALEYAESGDQYAIFVNKTLYKKYGDLLTAMRRTTNRTALVGGWTGIEFAAGAGKVGVFIDYDVPDGEVLIVNLDSWNILQVSDLDWMEDPKQGALVRNSGYLTYEATMAWFLNLLCLTPAANGRMTQKTD